MSSSKFRGRFAGRAIAVAVLGGVGAAPAHGQICVGLPDGGDQVMAVVLGSGFAGPPPTDPQYLGVGYARVIGERLTISGSAQVPIADSDSDFRRVAVELSAALPHTLGPGCPVVTVGYSVSSGVQEAAPHLAAGYGLGWRWDGFGDDTVETSFVLYAIPGVLADRKQDYSPGGSTSTRIRFASDLGFLIYSGAHFYTTGGLRRAFLDGGGTSLVFGVGWRF